MSGQVAGLIKDIKPCKEIIGDIVSYAEKKLDFLHLLKEGDKDE